MRESAGRRWSITYEQPVEALQRTPNGEFLFLPMDKVLFGPGSLGRLDDEIERLGCKRVILVSTASLVQSQAMDDVKSAIGSCLAGTFSGSRQHVPSESVLACVQQIEELDADLVVTLGGGSVIDTAKASILAVARDTGHFIPHIALPTTLSASEFSPTFGMTDERTRTKTRAMSPFIAPRTVILDTNLTAHTPDWLWLASGARAIDHAVETIYAPNHQPATDAAAMEAIRLLFQHLPASVGDQDRTEARQKCQIAAWLSFFGVANISLGLSHALGREIGPRYDVPHGYTSAVLLPYVMSYLLPETRSRQMLIARAAGVDQAGHSEAEIAAEAAPTIASFFASLDLPRRLRDLHVPEGDIDALAAGRQDVAHILRQAW